MALTYSVTPPKFAAKPIFAIAGSRQCDFERLVAAQRRVRCPIDPHDPDVIGEARRRPWAPGAEPGQALLDLGDDLGALGLAELAGPPWDPRRG